MSSIDIAVSSPIRRDETVQISLLLAFAGGYLDAYTAIYIKVEGVGYSSVMITGNAVAFGKLCSLRRPCIFAALCIAFGMGAAVGAYATKDIPDLALGLPLVALVLVMFRCEKRPDEDRL